MATNTLQKLIIAIVITIIGLVGYEFAKEQKLESDQVKQYVNRIESKLNERSKQFEKVWSTDTLISLMRSGLFRQDVFEALEERNLFAAVFKNKQVIFWSTTELDQDIFSYQDSMGYSIAEVKRGLYMLEVRRLGDEVVMLAAPIYQKIQNAGMTMLPEGFDETFDLKVLAQWSFLPQSDYSPVKPAFLQQPIFFQFETTNQSRFSIRALIFLIIFSLGLFASLLLLYEHLKSKWRHSKTILFLAILVFSLRFLSEYFLYPEPLFGFFDSFDNQWHNWHFVLSPGNLLIDASLLLIFVYLFYINESTQQKNQHPTLITGLKSLDYLLWVTVAFCSTIGLVAVIKVLVLQTSFSPDVSNLINEPLQTIIAMVITTILMLTHFLILQIVAQKIRIKRVNFSYKPLFILLVAIIFLGTCIAFSFYADFAIGLIYLVLIAALFVIRKGLSTFLNIVSTVIVFCLFGAGIMVLQLDQKDQEERKVLAQKLYSPKDENAEQLLLDVETKLERDALLHDYFKNPVILKPELEKRIKQLYFSGYLARFDVDIFDFDTLGNSFKELNHHPFVYMEDVYNNRTESTLSNYFYFINDASLRFGYIAKYEVCEGKDRLGIVFIMLKPKFLQDEKLFAEVFITNGQKRSLDNQSQYSYAIYQNEVLSSQSGTFSYPIMSDLHDKPLETMFYAEGYSHWISSKEGNIILVISKERKPFSKALSIFSFFLLSFTLLLAFFFIVSFFIAFLTLKVFKSQFLRLSILDNGFNFVKQLIPQRQIRGLYFSTRIQIATISLVLIALVITCAFTIRYISYKYASRQLDRLNGKVKSITNAIENERGFEGMLQFSALEVEGYLNQLAEFYHTDIHLYDLNGGLIATTQPRIFQSGLMLNQMNPKAFAQVSTMARSQYVQSEQMGAFDYVAAYFPVFDSRHQMLAYINIPYFGNQEELKQDTSSFLESFINIYVLFFLLSVISAYYISRRLTSPLLLIQQKLSETKLDNKNERLEWKQNDEIGQLVSQYNQMLEDLEKSALMLAQNEREGAWKEMAKQIAHEIKNPLTPMKLSVQHLQRAWADQSPHLEASFKRVTSVLIEQIDSLSLLASEFSSFAKMPEIRPEWLDFNEVLRSIVLLYLETDEVKFEQNFWAKPIHVFADKDQISRVFNNIIKNAIQAKQSHGEVKIEISTHIQDKLAVAIISDNGIGMSNAVSERVFSPSFSTKTSGMGLGLAISKQIIENCGGQIQFTTQEGKGSSFIVSIPCHH